MRTLATLPLVLVLVACGDFQPAGIEEPIKVERATFHRELIPGFEPGTTDASGPRVVGVETATTIVRPGELGRYFAGNVTDDAHTVGVQFVDHGTGWWGVSVGGPDPFVSGQHIFQFHADIGDVPAGNQRLRFVAVNEHGEGGPFYDVAVCVPNQVPDNRNGCDPTRRPPATVVTMQFGNRADVDLILVGADGRTVDGKRPAGGPGGNPAEPTNPRLDRDSNTRCVPDGFNRENIVFEEDPAEGSWDVFVNLFNACGEASTTFVVEIFRRVDRDDGTYGFESTERTTGVLRAQDANGGTGSPLYVTTLQFP